MEAFSKPLNKADMKLHKALTVPDVLCCAVDALHMGQ